MERSIGTLRAAALATAAVVAAAGSAFGAVAVVVNHTDADVAFTVSDTAGRSQSVRLTPGQSRPLFSTAPLTATYPTPSGPASTALAADSAYRFATTRLGQRRFTTLRRIGVGPAVAPAAGVGWDAGGGFRDEAVRVLLCVDEEEPMHGEVWRDRLAERIAAASEVLRRHAGVRLEVHGYTRWRSTNNIGRFETTLAEFERSVSPPEGVLAIGFTSQHRMQRGRQRMGGTRGPLRRHILLREWSPTVGEPERVELLVHELGHYLGAAHSPEPTSVMRPVLGDRPVRLKDETIRFDPVNTLAVAMVGEEVRRRGIRALGQLSKPRRDRLAVLYATLSALTPGAPAGAARLERLAAFDQVRELANAEAEAPRDDAALAVAAVTGAAAANSKEPISDRVSGDALTDRLVRAAATAVADGARAGEGARALLVGVGVALDNSAALAGNPRTRAAVVHAETRRDRLARLNVLGEPTARGRKDTVKHFAVSAALAAILGEEEANLWGVGKELLDSSGGTGFSFADVAANRAGVRFARAVTEGKLSPAALGRTFRIANFVPKLDDLPEGLSRQELSDRYGVAGDPRYDGLIEEIDRRIEALPPYAMLDLRF